MLIAFISDIHGNLPALKAAVADTGARSRPSSAVGMQAMDPSWRCLQFPRKYSCDNRQLRPEGAEVAKQGKSVAGDEVEKAQDSVVDG